MKNLNWIFYIKYVLLVFLFIFIIRLMTGEGSSAAPIEQVDTDVTAAIDMNMLSAADHRMFKRLYGLNANDYEAVSLYVSGSNMEVEELLIVRLSDQSQAESVETAINSRLEKQLQSFEGYGPDQCKLLNDHILDVRGNYILFIVHGDAAAADKAFRKSL